MTIEPFLLEITLPFLCVAGAVGFCLLQQKNMYQNLSEQRNAKSIREEDRLADKDNELLEKAQELAERCRELRNKLNKMQNKPIDDTPIEIDSEDLEELIEVLSIAIGNLLHDIAEKKREAELKSSNGNSSAIGDLQPDIAEKMREDKLKSNNSNSSIASQAGSNAFFLKPWQGSESDVNKASLTFSFCGKE